MNRGNSNIKKFETFQNLKDATSDGVKVEYKNTHTHSQKSMHGI